MSLLADVTAVMSEVGRERPDLVQERSVSLFIDLVIEKARPRHAFKKAQAEIAPVDFDPN